MMSLLEKFNPIVRLFQPRQRRVAVDREWGHVEFRNLDGEELSAFIQQVQVASRSLDRLRWVEVHPYLRRVIFSFPRDTYSAAELTKVVEQAEAAARIDSLPFSDIGPRHPGDDEPLLQLMVELSGDLFGLVLGLLLGALPVSPVRTATTATPILALMRDLPRFRRWLDDRLGREQATLVLNLTLALAQGLSQRPVSSTVDLVYRATKLREQRNRQSAWHEREAELCSAPSSPEALATKIPSRPKAIPKGPIEEYTDRAWLISLGGFTLSILTTGSMQRAAAALFGALPKPARLGREAFACEFGFHLANRGIIVLDADRLRLLDRIDCLVIQGDLVSSHSFVLGRIKVSNAIDEQEGRQTIEAMFDPDAPLDVRRTGDWELGPPALIAARLEPELEGTERALAARGELALGLARGDQIVALAEVRVVPHTGVEELISAAHKAEMRVVVAATDESVLEGLHAEDIISEREGLHSGIRRIQREGRVVCLVASGDSPGLPVADVGIGLFRLGEPTPWGAHLICHNNLVDVRFILQACVTARAVSKQCVNVALGAATMGAVVSASGLVPMTTRRAMILVNAATLVSMLNGARATSKLKRRDLPPPRDPTPWHALEARGALTRLGSSTTGLSRREAIRRREVSERSPTAAAELLEAITDELFNPFTPLLAAGAGLSALVGSNADAGVVAGVVGLNAVVGGIQRFRTERAIRLLARETRRRTRTRRGNRTIEIPSSKLVPGDVVLLGPGETVPADCRLIGATSLEVDASSLTGESLPVPKNTSPSFEAQIADRTSMLYQGTSIAAGRAEALVVAVGGRTEAQRGAFAAKGDRAQGGVERRLRSLMGLTGPVALIAGFGVVGAGMLRGRRLEDLIGSGVSLAVASVPEGLPLLATAAQLAASERLSRRGVLVRNVRSIEALGRVDVICLDKTGTLTMGRVELRSISDGVAEQKLEQIEPPGRAILAAALRAAARGVDRSVHADPTDEALFRGAQAAHVGPEIRCPGWTRIEELPFEAGRSYHAVLGESAQNRRIAVKGATEKIIPACIHYSREGGAQPIDEATRGFLVAEADRLASRGLRVLAVAETVVPDDQEEIDLSHLKDLTFYGFLTFSDPVRPSATEAIKGLHRAGIHVLMLTGDHPSTAAAIAAELRLADEVEVLTGAEIASMTNEELQRRLRRVSVLARTTPSQKVRVIRALQRMDRVVAMAGDGSNDAPAIRLANVGIAIGERSTAAARGAADVVLTDESIEAIVEAVSEGRAMWSSVRDAVSVLVGGNLGEIGFTLAAGLVDGRPPLNARQLLLVNLLTDAAPSMAIALRPPSDQMLETLVNEGPDVSLGHPLNRAIASRATITALGAGTAWTLGRVMGSQEKANTMGLVAVVSTQLGQTLLSGGANTPVLVTGFGSVAALIAMIQTPGISRFFGCTPLGPLAWSTALGSSAAATYLSVTVPRIFERLTDRIQSGLSQTPLVSESAVEDVVTSDDS